MFVFLTYGNDSFSKSLLRIEKEAEDFVLFDRILCKTEISLKEDCDFWPRHKEFFERHPRGNGYWLWKPYLIWKTLCSLSEGDILVYADAGCSFNSKGKVLLCEWIGSLPQRPLGMLLFESWHFECKWTKKDVFLKLNATQFKDRKQIAATYQLIRVSKETIQFYKELYDTLCDYTLLDDSASKAPNYPEFIEHRHDQSCLSLLARKYGVQTISARHLPKEIPIVDTRMRN
jgi:hypothetical protein